MDRRKSHEIYARAQQLMPGGVNSPARAFGAVGGEPVIMQRGEGAYLFDVDGNRYIDFVNGLLAISLGYRDPDVDRAVRAQLERGITFSLATELEAELAELLVELVPCAEMVRFGKNGSDATTAAVRLARAYTGRDRVAVCGYHGWHDWYISSTSRHLGVPEAVRRLTSTFPYNDADALESLLADDPDGFAAVILEPTGPYEPEAWFLEGLRELTLRYGVILIFDEIITGFRIDMGGAQAVYGVTPDLATFGKSMGNGMPISAVVGRADIMSWMEKIFFSGTFGGEALSLAASLATIEKLRRENAVQRMLALGRRLREGVKGILADHDLSLRYAVEGSDWWPRVSVADGGNVPGVIATSLLRQELVAVGLLLTRPFNLCLAHDDEEIVSETFVRWQQAAERLADAFASNDPATHLRGEPVQPIFQVRPD